MNLFHRKKMIIIGAGISGLAAAYRLLELKEELGLDFDLTVLEASSRAGGVLEGTVEDDVILEGGAESFITEKPWALDLCKRLGLREALVETNPNARKSFILRNGQLVPVPKGFYLIAPTLLWPFLQSSLLSLPGKLRVLQEPFIRPKEGYSDETLASFVRRRFGKEALERLAQPMVGGIYTADPEKLSLAATFPKFLKMEQKYGSVLKGLSKEFAATKEASGPRYRLFLTLKKGMQQLVDTLLAELPRETVQYERKATRVRALAKGWEVMVQDGRRYEADELCLALPAPAAAMLLQDSEMALAQKIAQIPYESVATVNMLYRLRDVPHPLDGFGYVVPHVEGRAVVGCTFSSVKFPGRAQSDQALLRAFVGGAMQPHLVSRDNAEIEKIVRDEFKKTLGIRAAPVLVSVKRYFRSMAQYHLGHVDLVATIDQMAHQKHGLYLIGNAYHGVGIPDCVHGAELAAEKMVARLFEAKWQEAKKKMMTTLND